MDYNQDILNEVEDFEDDDLPEEAGSEEEKDSTEEGLDDWSEEDGEI